MNLLTRVDPRIECVRKFEKRRKDKGRSSVLTDAVRYAKEDFGITLEPMENDFMVESANITNLDEKAEGMNILLENKNDIKINSILSNSFGFGGTNASIYLTSFNE